MTTHPSDEIVEKFKTAFMKCMGGFTLDTQQNIRHALEYGSRPALTAVLPDMLAAGEETTLFGPPLGEGPHPVAIEDDPDEIIAEALRFFFACRYAIEKLSAGRIGDIVAGRLAPEAVLLNYRDIREHLPLAFKTRRITAAAGEMNLNEIEHRAEESESTHMWLDEKGIPRDKDGKVYSLVGRIVRFGCKQYNQAVADIHADTTSATKPEVWTQQEIDEAKASARQLKADVKWEDARLTTSAPQPVAGVSDEVKTILDAIADALESRGYFHMANAKGISSIIDEMQIAARPFITEIEFWGDYQDGKTMVEFPLSACRVLRAAILSTPPQPARTQTADVIRKALATRIGDSLDRCGADGAFLESDEWQTIIDALLAAPQPAPLVLTDQITVDVQRMNTSRGPDFFVRIKCGPRSVTPHVFGERFKAEYEAAHYAWVFGLRPDEPHIMAYDENSHPNDESADAVIARETGGE